MKTKRVNDALLMALWKRKPDRGLLWHTDRGSLYGLREPPGVAGTARYSPEHEPRNCWDNAVAESFFHTLKTETLLEQERFELKSKQGGGLLQYEVRGYIENGKTVITRCFPCNPVHAGGVFALIFSHPFYG